MEAERALVELGGVAGAGDLLRLTTRARLRAAVASRRVERAARGVYRLPGPPEHLATAVAMSGRLSHLGAARHWGWALVHEPERPWVTVPRGRHADSRDVHLFHADLRRDEVRGAVTAPLRTVTDCARVLGFAEALAVADSALRAGAVGQDELREAARECRGPGSRQVRLVAQHAHGGSANPFESVLRAMVIEVGGLDVVPQVEVTCGPLTFAPDLVDVERRVVIEAESRAFHTDERTLDRDCVRYSLLTLDGWLVLRFTWHQVMRSSSYVRGVLERASALVAVRAVARDAAPRGRR